MRRKATNPRSLREKEKSEYIFIVYQQMGEGRSLAKLGEVVRAIGVKISDKSLERYSARYDWQRRVLEASTVQKERLEKSIQQQVEKMNQQHAQIAQGFMAVVVAKLQGIQSRIKDKDPLKDMSYSEMATLFRAAQYGERLARGQATSRVEIWLDITQTVVREFGLIFLSVYNMQDREAMKAEFIRLSDEMLNRYFSETSKQSIQIEGGKYQ